MHTMEVGTANVPAFLTKLWKLVEDPTYCDLISWSSNGRSFVIKNPTRFSKELLPLFFKHNNMASFIRQLNMYGFRKLTSIENSGLRSERDEMEFYHQYFLKQQENLLEYIKRKASTNSSSSSSSGHHHHHHHGSGALVANGHNGHPRHGGDHGCNGAKVEEVHELLTSIMQRQDAHENFRVSVQNEYSTLWKEIAYLRQQNAKQQTIVQRLIQFLMSLVQTQNQRNVSPNKRKATLMIDDVGGSSTLPPAAKRLNLEAGPSTGSATSSSTSSALTHSNGSQPQASSHEGNRSSFSGAGSNSRSEQAIRSGIFDAITSGLSNGPTIHDVTDDVIDTELEAAANSNPTISLPNAAEIDRHDLPAPLFQDIDLDVLNQVLELTSSAQQQQNHAEEEEDECSKDTAEAFPLDPELLLETVLPIVSQASLPPLVSSLVTGILTDPQIKISDRSAASAAHHHKHSQPLNYWSEYESLPAAVSSSGSAATSSAPAETPDYLIDPSSLLEEKDADLSALIPDLTNGHHNSTQRMSHYNCNR